MATYTHGPGEWPKRVEWQTFPDEVKQTLQKNQTKQKPWRLLPRSLAKGLRKTKKNKKNKDFTDYGPSPDPMVSEIFVFFGFFGFSEAFC